MSNSDVRIERPLEGAQRRKLNLVGWTLGIAAVLVAVGSYYFARGMQQHAQNAAYPRVVVRTAGGGDVVVTQGTDRAQQLSDGEATFRRIIIAPNASEFEGQTLDVFDSLVLDVVGDRIFTVGPHRDESLLVRISDQTDHRVHVKSSQFINIVGTLRDMPPVEQRRDWGLSADEETLVGRYRVYLDAQTIEVTPHSPEHRPGG